MKKFLALLMALAMVLSLAACGGNDEPETTAAPEETTVAEVEADATTVAEAEETTVAEETSAEAEETTAAEAEETTAAEAEETTAAVAGDMSQADFAAFLNAETAKIAKSGKFSEISEAWTPTAVGEYIKLYYDAESDKFIDVARG